jgi:MbtH protein
MSDREYRVVRNDEEQYALWPADPAPPAGWHDVGVRGTEAECMAYVDEVWTDLRPASLRAAMDGDGVGTARP